MKNNDMDTEINGGSFVGFLGATFLAGVATGLIAGLLLAPKTGKETRGMVKEQFGSVRDKLRRRGNTQEEPLASTQRADYLH
jgi:gas vesicle protein